MKHSLLLFATIITLLVSTISCSLFSTGANKPNEPDEVIPTDTTYIRDYEYQERRIFDLALPIDNLRPSDQITKLIMYESTLDFNANDTQTVANFYVSPDDTMYAKFESIRGSNVVVKEILSDQFEFFNDSDRNIHYVVFDTPLSRNSSYGYYMEVVDTLTGMMKIFGNLSDTIIVTDTVITLNDTTYINKIVYNLKLLCKQDDYYPSYSDQTWRMMWRNCYEIPVEIPLKDLKFKIYKGLEGLENSPSSSPVQFDGVNDYEYLEILGLDLWNSYLGVNIPDGIVDESPHIYRPDLGLLIFPSRRPFDTDTTYFSGSVELPQLEYTIRHIYDYTSWTRKIEDSHYFIRLEQVVH